MTIREKVTEELAQQSDQAAIKAHHRNVHTLYVMPDGRTYWEVSIYGNPWDAIPKTNTPVLALYRTGCSSSICGCRNCLTGIDPAQWVHDFDGGILHAMRTKLNDIPYGYFDDEYVIG